MILQFSITGTARKALVGALAEITGEKAKYTYAPDFAYEVGGYRIDKHGTLTGPDDQAILDALAEKGYTDPETGRAYDLAEINAPEPALYVPELAPRCNPDHDYNADFPSNASQVDFEENDLIIELPREGFDETAFDNLEKLIASKASLLRKALGTDDLDFRLTEETIQFPWFTTAGTPEESEAYARLAFALCEAAKQQKRVTAKEKPVDNEKYAFRCFLLRLGFVGEESKTARRILLRNLSGNGAFKSGSRKAVEDDNSLPRKAEDA